ncbi:MAG: hypothetical protein GY811_13660 [Myxococcales bacterium]|nr:hypothetical protein [Myxococcales bacterium]
MGRRLLQCSWSYATMAPMFTTSMRLAVSLFLFAGTVACSGEKKTEVEPEKSAIAASAASAKTVEAPTATKTAADAPATDTGPVKEGATKEASDENIKKMAALAKEACACKDTDCVAAVEAIAKTEMTDGVLEGLMQFHKEETTFFLEEMMKCSLTMAKQSKDPESEEEPQEAPMRNHHGVRLPRAPTE